MAVLRIKALLKRLPKCFDLAREGKKNEWFPQDTKLYPKTMELEGGTSPEVMAL